MDLLSYFPELSLTTYLTTVVVLIVIFQNRNIFYWRNKGIPYVTPFPFFGSTKLMSFMRKSLHQNEDKYYQKYGPIFGHVEGDKITLNLGIPELVHQITVKEFPSFHNRAFFPNPQELSRKMLFTLRDEDWKRIRSAVTPTFTSGKMRKMTGLITECCKSLIENISSYSSQGSSIDMKKIYGAFTMDVIASTAFGIRLDSHKDPDNPFVKNARGFFTRDVSFIFPFALAMPNFFYYLAKGIPSLNFFPIDFFRDITMNVIKERRESNLKDTEKKVDFLQLMIDSAEDMQAITGKSTNALSESEIFAQSIAFFVVGFDTTATAISFATYELAKNPGVQKKLAEEIDRVLKENNGELNYDTVNKMEYLDAVFSETLRLYPTAPRIDREVCKEYKLPKYDIVLEKGSHVQVSIYSMHRDPKNFENPDAFIPERFLPESKLHFDQYAYMPFGQGPRSCVAMRFATMEAKICLASVFQRYTFSFDPKIGDKFEYMPGTFLLQPVAIPLIVKERKANK